MNVETLCEGMLDALDEFDKSISPLGLYSSDDLGGRNRGRHPQWNEWTKCLAPHLQKQGSEGVEKYLDEKQKTLFDVPELGFTQFQIVRLSKIKVRKFGEHYQMDKHRNYADRWEDASMKKHLTNLWSETDDVVKLRLLLLIGFDKTEMPFGGALHELLQATNWQNHEVQYFTRTWQDRYERNFGVRLSLWAL